MSKDKSVSGDAVKEIWVHSPPGGSIYIEPISGDAIPYEGRKVFETPFWKRRINAGDVIKGKPKK